MPEEDCVQGGVEGAASRHPRAGGDLLLPVLHLLLLLLGEHGQLRGGRSRLRRPADGDLAHALLDEGHDGQHGARPDPERRHHGPRLQGRLALRQQGEPRRVAARLQAARAPLPAGRGSRRGQKLDTKVKSTGLQGDRGLGEPPTGVPKIRQSPLSAEAL